MTREEHMKWCKERALRELDFYEDVQEAVRNSIVSISSDLRKHPETRNHSGIELGIRMLFGGFINSKDEARKFIEGFN